jgi:hypothetical protein
MTLSLIECDAGEVEGQTGQNRHSLGGTMLLDCENGERGGLASSCILVRVVRAYERGI